MLTIKWQDHTTNISVMEKVHNLKSLVNIILKKKLEFLGHIARMDRGNLEKLSSSAWNSGRFVAGCAGRGRRKPDGLTTFVDREAWREFFTRTTTGGRMR